MAEKVNWCSATRGHICIKRLLQAKVGDYLSCGGRAIQKELEEAAGDEWKLDISIEKYCRY